MKICKMILAVGVLSNLFAISTWAKPIIDSKMITEYNYFSLNKARSFEEMVQFSAMSSAHKKEVLAYLRGHDLMKVKPAPMSWTGNTAIIGFTVKTSKISIDYSKIAKHQVAIQGKTITLPADAPFSETVKTFRAAFSPSVKAAFFGLPLMNMAMAQNMYETDNSETDLGTVIGYYAGGDLLLSCLISNENDMSVDCPFRSDASMIKSAIQDPNYISEFTCKGEKISTFNYWTAGDGGWEMRVEYNEDGKYSKINLHSDNTRNFADCRYFFTDEGTLDRDIYGESYCNKGQAEGKLKPTSGELKKGEVPRAFMNMPVSLSRLQKCCQSTECRSEIKNDIVARNKKIEAASKKFRGESGAQ